MNTQQLDHEHFEAVQVLAEIGTKISAGKAELDSLNADKEAFLEGREADAIARVAQALNESRSLLDEVAGYYSELVGFRNAIDAYVVDVRNLIQNIERWKEEFDEEITHKNQEIDAKVESNREILAEVRGRRALLAGETEGIEVRRAALRADETRIKDEWETLGRAAKEINGKK